MQPYNARRANDAETSHVSNFWTWFNLALRSAGLRTAPAAVLIKWMEFESAGLCLTMTTRVQTDADAPEQTVSLLFMDGDTATLAHNRVQYTITQSTTCNGFQALVAALRAFP
jgi:hypothetical protein